MVEFHISSSDSVTNYKDNVVITGMVNSGTVRKGSIFNCIRPWPDSLGETTHQGNDIRLVVKKIIAYRTELDELETGMTGELHIDGLGIEQVGTNALLVVIT